MTGVRNVGRRIVCAANRNEAGKIILGVRHFDMLMAAQIKEYFEELSKRGENVTDPKYSFQAQQGFIDNRGNYVSREKAWKIAQEAGQIIRRVGGDTRNGGTLFSENLY